MLDHDAVSDRESQSRAFSSFLRRKERFKDPGSQLDGNARAVVLDSDGNSFIRRSGAHKQLAWIAVSDNGVQRVIDEVNDNLLDLIGIGFDQRQIGLEIKGQVC